MAHIPATYTGKVSAPAATARRALALMDLTDLGTNSSVETVARLCTRAIGPFGLTAAVCVWPRFVTTAAQQLAGSGVRVATVVNFPEGGVDVDNVVQQAGNAIQNGADEVDLVLPYRAFLRGDINSAAAMLDAVRVVVPRWATLKVILESGSYPDLDSIRSAARFAIDCGANFVKTSTGKTAVSATLAAAVMILDAIRDSDRPVGFKPSGGIRSVDDAGHYLALADEMLGPEWATPATFRFGASGLLDALELAIADSGS
jgi:deoxyribose-phosphate aldolase